MKNKKYQSHIGAVGLNLGDIMAEHSVSNNKDLYYMNLAMKPHMEYLRNHNILKLLDYDNVLRKKPYKIKCKTIKQIIKSFEKKYKSTRCKGFTSCRELNKTNKVQRNILINRYSCEFEDVFFNFIDEFLRTSQNGLTDDARYNIMNELKSLKHEDSVEWTDFSFNPVDFDDEIDDNQNEDNLFL